MAAAQVAVVRVARRPVLAVAVDRAAVPAVGPRQADPVRVEPVAARVECGVLKAAGAAQPLAAPSVADLPSKVDRLDARAVRPSAAVLLSVGHRNVGAQSAAVLNAANGTALPSAEIAMVRVPMGTAVVPSADRAPVAAVMPQARPGAVTPGSIRRSAPSSANRSRASGASPASIVSISP